MTAPDPTTRGYDHVALCYADDRELLASAVPFIAGGVERGDAVMIALEPARAEVLLNAVDQPDAVTVLAIGAQYARPAGAIKSYSDLFTKLVTDGAQAVRLIGELPAPVLATAWDVWARYEAAVNYAFDRFPVSTLCAYDARTTPPAVLDDVAKTHSLLASPDGNHTPNPTYVDPPSFLARTRPTTPHPVQLRAPALELVDPAPGDARRAVVAANAGTLGPDALDDLVMSVSEIVTNALRYGLGPRRLRLWVGVGHLVVTVHDAGPGPADPFAGLLPKAGHDGGGYGLWIAHQLCDHVTLDRDASGFTVRLTMGDPHQAV
ncbi:anti-sigma factor RsbA family regulatory protein [Actinokineospora diospyrosa]|uniref:Histidine kinase-like ATPase domain-containing protein n=1 Tax=Actinokineospora diospyrosa TaxID=103728 RepID=A0ABT1IEF4_9PSEU|nr:anti-sigma factor RsbA family regulatory protein [Actinokineospora diospyrosa]MCP2271013.1 Histidine kinase-like ATPase domain-containing protein [Actinokineospora diospyrosa]